VPQQPFRYRSHGNLATVGRSFAVVESGPLHLTGFLAWVMWLAVHIFYLIGFRNRLLVMFQWAWEYLTRQRSARLITCGDATEPSSWQQLTLTSTLQESSVCQCAIEACHRLLQKCNPLVSKWLKQHLTFNRKD
jgi:hypothetical protein